MNSLEGVHHVGWQEDPAPYLSISDYMVFPSEREGMPVCVMEASAMGVPVIAIAARGTRSLLRDEGAGLLISERRSSAVAHAMLTCMAHGKQTVPSERASISRKLFYEHTLDSYL